MKSESIAQIAQALALAQAKMKAAQMNATNPFLKNKYADLGSVIEAVRSPLSENGLAFTQLVTNEGEAISLETILMHKSGEWIGATMTLPLDDKKGLSLAQNTGAVITYMRRYALSAMLGIYADEDTDGQGDGKKPAPKTDKPAPEPPPVAPDMTLEEAMKVTSKDGTTYGSMPDSELAHVINGILDAQKAGKYPEKAQEYALKLKAAQMILAARQG
jgi:hypothetical protein